jgi:hypothetical protein
MKTPHPSRIVLLLSAIVSLSVAAAPTTPAAKTPAAAPAPAAIPKSTFSLSTTTGATHDPFFPARLMQSGEVKTQAVVAARPSMAGCLVLKGLSGTTAEPLAIINTRTMSRGEDAEIVTECGRLLVHCVDITTNSAIVEVAGERRELRLRSDF